MNDLTEEQTIRLVEYLDGDLTPDARAAFERELASDSALAAALAQARGAVDALRALDAPPAPVDLGARVASRIRRRSRGRYFGDGAVQRERAQPLLFTLVSIALLAGTALLSTPASLRALLGEATYEIIDDGSGEGSGLPTSEGSHPEEDPGGGTQGDPPPSGELHPAPPAPGTPAPGTVTPFRSAAVRRMDPHYRIDSSLAPDALERRLREQFGPTRVRVDGASIHVTVPRAQLAETLTRVGDLGVVHRELREVDPTRETLDITFEPRQ